MRAQTAMRLTEVIEQRVFNLKQTIVSNGLGLGCAICVLRCACRASAFHKACNRASKPMVRWSIARRGIRIFRHTWAKGAAAGFVLAVLVVVAAYVGLTEGRLDEEPSLVTEVLWVLAAMPLFATAPVRNTPEAVQVVLFAAWCAAVGAVVGWGIGKGATSRVLAGLRLVFVVASHVHTKIKIEREVGGALRAFGTAIEGVVEWRICKRHES